MTVTQVGDTGMFGLIAAGVICLVGCIFGCCLIPFCMDDLKKVIHKCPNCNNILGIHDPHM